MWSPWSAWEHEWKVLDVQGGERPQSVSRRGAEAELRLENTTWGDQETGEEMVVNVQKMQGLTSTEEVAGRRQEN